MNRKATYEFGTATGASDVLTNYQKFETITRPDLKGNCGMFPLKLRSVLDIRSRQVLLDFRKFHQRFGMLLQGRFTVGSNGLGGDVFILRNPEDPVRVAHLSAQEGSSGANVDIEQTTVVEFIICSETVPLLEAANTAVRRLLG